MKDYIFNTIRTGVRHLGDLDLTGFYDMQSNPNVMKFIKPAMSFEESKKELERFINLYKSEDNFYKIWAIENLETKAFLGICGVYENGEKEIEIAYRLREKYWGLGYGGEIADGLIKHCFHELSIGRLIAYVMPGNKGSIKILRDRMMYIGEVETRDGVEKKFELINH